MTKRQMEKAGAIIKDYGMAEEFKCMEYLKALEWIKGGVLACNFDKARRELADIYEETEEEAAKYENYKVWDQYCHVMAMMAGRVKYLA